MIRSLCAVLALYLLLPTPVSAQPSLLPQLQAARAKYPASQLTKEQLSDLLNSVAWDGRAQGWGSLEKGTGNNCPYGPGAPSVRIACDILMHRPTCRIFDVLVDQEGTAGVTWSEAHGSPADCTRWRGPIGSVEAPPPPAPTPAPVPTAPLAELARRVAQLEKENTQLAAGLAELLTRPEVTQQIIQALIDAALADLTLTVEGSTSRSFGHTHRVELKADRK